MAEPELKCDICARVFRNALRCTQKEGQRFRLARRGFNDEVVLTGTIDKCNTKITFDVAELLAGDKRESVIELEKRAKRGRNSGIMSPAPSK